MSNQHHPPNNHHPQPQQQQLPPRRNTKPPLQHVKPNHQKSKQHESYSYSEEEKTEIQSKLSKVLGPEYIAFRPGGGGTQVQYIEGWKALNLANEIFGFNGWNSELISCEIDFFDTHGNSGKYSLGLSVVVRVTIKDGTYHEDIGYGYIENAKSKAAAFEKCKKEAFTDGIKRCLRCFGNVLGNCLYEKTIMKQIKDIEKKKIEYQPEDFYRDPIFAERERKKEIQERRMEQEKLEEEARIKEEEERLKRIEEEKIKLLQQQQQQQQQQQRYQNNLPPSSNAFVTPISPSKIIKNVNTNKKEVDDMDESFLFSDDVADEQEELEQVRNNSDKQEQNNSDKQEPPNQSETSSNNNLPPVTSFVSARSAALNALVKDKDAEFEKFDNSFVSPNIRRTVDPKRSMPIKRSSLKSPSPSINNNNNNMNNNNNNHLINTTNKLNITAPNILNTNNLNNPHKRYGVPPSIKPNKKKQVDSVVDN
ncbi:RAD52 [Candida pseudojiufengensis]|uniref:RAD52 n=1 Tax=Candida pseudojiufengensis TaxID=497109 RepID=UPI0022258A0E|nr:RAD52 [Candida pseudojiufengensis]KAI5962937.1 RAD52 [Candida pseudojiufengensis]